MFLKKKVSFGDKSGVRFVNGMISFGSVKLNVHCFETDGVLIDTGSKTLLPSFKPFFAEADVDMVLITHHHEDHTGGARYLQKQYGLPIFMDGQSIQACAKKAGYPLYRKLFWGNRPSFQALPVGESFASRQAAWKAIRTPGHADDHLAFLNEETGQLFSGDLYVQPRTKLILREESIPLIIRSIKEILTYDFGEMFCCHAGYIKNGQKAMRAKLDYLTELQERTIMLWQQGRSEREIQSILFPKKYPISKFSSGEWDSLHIVRSILRETEEAGTS